MPDMTKEEYAALEEEVSRNPPDVSGKPGGFFTDRRDRMVMLDTLSAGYVRTAAEVQHKTPTEVISEMVRERIAAQTAP
jgi:hypothetical protein